MSATKINRIHKELSRLRADFQADSIKLINTYRTDSLKLIEEIMTLAGITPADLDAYMQAPSAGRRRGSAAKAKPIATGRRTVASLSAPRVGNYRRGSQPAKYRDPKTGATWSGLARPPAWIATVKDRTKFLIQK